MGQKGFTLVEILVTLVLIAFLAAMVAPYMLSGVTRAGDPFARMGAPLSLQSILGNIIADYNSNATYLHDLSQLAGNITTGNYGLTAAHTVTKNATFKFDAADANTALLVTIRDNATNLSVTYIFTRQL